MLERVILKGCKSFQRHDSDAISGPGAFSDGKLRFICLATLFLQPHKNMPATIVLDEPELGLHPMLPNCCPK
jgi:predicted ATPase